jgi:hypothetical protein
MPRFVLPMLLFALLTCGAALVVVGMGSPKPRVIITGPPRPRPPPPVATYVAMRKAIEGMDVSAEVDSALRRGDRRLLYIASGYPPGVEEDYGERWAYYHKEYGVRWIPYTSDVGDGPEHEQMQLVAGRFAERYNRLLLQRTSASTRPSTTPVR